jgi:sugar lactone lactonase YvrE
VTVDTAGNIYIADVGNRRIRKVNAEGIISTVAGNGTKGFAGDGGPATSAQIDPFGAHQGLAVDSVGNLYFADIANHRIRKVDTAGIISTVAGNGTAGFSGDGGPAFARPLNNPTGLALDSAGNLYIGDTTNLRVRKVAMGPAQ